RYAYSLRRASRCSRVSHHQWRRVPRGNHRPWSECGTYVQWNSKPVGYRAADRGYDLPGVGGVAAAWQHDTPQADFSCGGNFNLPSQTLPSTGTYTILVDPQGTATGNISVAVTGP